MVKFTIRPFYPRKKKAGIRQTGGQIGPTTGMVYFREENIHF